MGLDSKFNSELAAFPVGIRVMKIPYIIATNHKDALEHYRKMKSGKIMMADGDNLNWEIYS